MLKVDNIKDLVDAVAAMQDKPGVLIAVLALACIAVVGFALYVVLTAVKKS